MSTSPLPEQPWTGCLGARLGPGTLAQGFGTCRGDPLLDVRLTLGSVEPPSAHEIWHLRGRVVVAGADVDFDQSLTRSADGALLVHAAGAALRVSLGARTITVDAEHDAVAKQLVTTYGLPLLLHEAPALLLHACAAIRPGSEEADVICAASGAGKSTLVSTLIVSGWRAVAEDLTAIDLRSDVLSVWPGPPWLRVVGGGPPGATARYQARDKTAWDIAPWQVDRPVPLGRLIFLATPGGVEPRWRELAAEAAVARVVQSTTWLADPSDRVRRTFGPSVRVARSVLAGELRLPHSSDWAVEAERMLRTL